MQVIAETMKIEKLTTAARYASLILDTWCAAYKNDYKDFNANYRLELEARGLTLVLFRPAKQVLRYPKGSAYMTPFCNSKTSTGWPLQSYTVWITKETPSTLNVDLMAEFNKNIELALTKNY